LLLLPHLLNQLLLLQPLSLNLVLLLLRPLHKQLRLPPRLLPSMLLLLLYSWTPQSLKQQPLPCLLQILLRLLLHLCCCCGCMQPWQISISTVSSCTRRSTQCSAGCSNTCCLRSLCSCC
jgi:hypothetical protein